MISIIVPVYNVEKYLNRCIESVLLQTIVDYELLLVNDGSTDSSLEICNKYKTKDARIKVIDKINGGLSSARNAGLDFATGDYIAFIDSDDYVYPTYLETLLRGIVENDCDISVCGTDDDWDGVKSYNNSIEYYVKERKILSSFEATRLLLEDKVIVSHVWDKMYKKALWEGVRFPLEKRFEDLYVTFKIFDKATLVCLMPDIEYIYVHREGSISYTKPVQNMFDIASAYYEQYCYFRNNVQFDDISNSLLCKSFSYYIESFNNYILIGNESLTNEQQQHIKHFVKANLKNPILKKRVCKKYFVYGWMICYFLKLYPFFYKLRGIFYKGTN